MDMFVKGLTHGLYIVGVLTGVGGGLVIVGGISSVVVWLFGFIMGIVGEDGK